MRTLLCFALLIGCASACRAQVTDTLDAKLQHGIAAYERGDRAAAHRIFDSFIDDYNHASGHLTARQLVLVGEAMRYLGEQDPQLFKDALKAFDEAAAADPHNVSARVQAGELFLDKYNSEEAQRSFTAALRIDSTSADALVGLARMLSFDNRPGALEAAQRALRYQPNHLTAHAFLAHVFLATDAVDSARVHAAAALRIAPQSLDAQIASAEVAQVTGDLTALTAVRNRLANSSTALAQLDIALAELSVQQRQYQGSVQLARAAIAADSLSWRAWSVLGINQLRMGDVDGARQSLTKSFAGDPYNVWVKNTLDLLDRMATFHTLTTGRFTIVASARDADVLAPYVSALGEEAFQKLQQRYGYTPQTPIRLELFDRHADFSVRTVGLAGLGALGVSFGNVLALDAPSAREQGEFNWGSTFWHELSHAFHLGMTDYRVPRWFTEGLAVLEERRARPGWGEEDLPAFMHAASAKKLLPLADLNDGFVRPTYPDQVVVSYYQASLIIEMVEQQFGAATTPALLRAFAKGKSTEAALHDVVGKTPAQIDALFATFVAQRLTDDSQEKAAREASDYQALVQQGTIPALENAIYLWPYDASVHNKLADLYAGTHNLTGVVRERQVIVALQPVDMAEARYQLALAQYQAGDMASAKREVLRALEGAPNFERAQELLLKLSEGK